MRRLPVSLLLIILSFGVLTIDGAALAGEVWKNYLKTDITGMRGIAADFYVKQRHYQYGSGATVNYNPAEYYVNGISGRGGSPQNMTAFGWQITDGIGLTWGESTNRFDCNLHVIWPDQTHKYYDRLFNLTQDNTRHRLKTEYAGNGVWNLYLEGIFVMQCIWPYYNTSTTYAWNALEVVPYNDNIFWSSLGVNPYMGRVYNVWVKPPNTDWKQQSSNSLVSAGYDNVPGQPANPWTKSNPYYTDYLGIYVLTPFWDWEARH